MKHSLKCSTSFMMRNRGRTIHEYLFLKKIKIVHFWRPVTEAFFSWGIKIHTKRIRCRTIHEVSLNPTFYGNNSTTTYVSTCRFMDLLNYYYHRLIYYKIHVFHFFNSRSFSCLRFHSFLIHSSPQVNLKRHFGRVERILDK